MQYAISMIALTVIRFVWPAVTAVTQPRDNTKPDVPTPVIQIEKRRPILLLQGRVRIRIPPSTLGMK